ncbi:class A beta-lactamase-related serine hydrolase [Anaerobacillus alkaliphilus]|uniref:Class A beta-lactamase-related serine hydrolase n=1 Tax=Anaerobacillus alkaliphilus TaxID=1548597 RepID=A0A4Q0VVG8_9BACI|nr:serine hydrolase domain-containing protein [Anaerobacillus alkaliphilus]RXJ02546.1 class A beta-lactamase-related serine hydrolase [Anaerobacillus alkaliphilus]
MKAIDLLISTAIEEGEFPGAVGYVEHKGKIIYHEAFGYASAYPQKRSMQKDMIFDVASITKIFTSTIILRLIAEKKLSLETKVSTFFPSLESVSTNCITVYHLLTHTSGFPAWYPFYTVPEAEDFLAPILKVKSFPDPGEKIEYSDLNFILLGKIIEFIEEAQLNEVVKEKLVVPLQLNTTCYLPDASLKDRIVPTEVGNQFEKELVKVRNLHYHGWREELIWGEVHDGNSHYAFRGVSGHAGIFSTVIDVAKLAKSYLISLKHEDTFLSYELAKNSIQRHVMGENEGRGLGWVVDFNGINGFGHTGFTGTSLWVVPEKELIMVLFTNRVHQPNPVNINLTRRRFYESVLKVIS